MARFNSGVAGLTLASLIGSKARATKPPAEPPGTAGSSASHGAGWFESSRELRCGLDVHEGVAANASLDEWLAHCKEAR